MSHFKVHSPTTAPGRSAELLQQAESAFGFVPNLLGTFAEAPATLEAYMTLGKLFDQTSFSATERQVVLLAVSAWNECHYCVAAHSTIAGMQKVPRDVVDAIRDNRPIPDPRLEALRRFTTAVVERRGWAGDEAVAEFTAAGYTQQQVLEVILGVAMKTVSNYTNHITETPLDAAFAGEAWSGERRRAS